MFKKLRTVIYRVEDINKAKEWYAAILGFRPYFDEPFYVGFDVNGYELGLDPDMNGVTKGNQSVAYWAVNDINTVVKALADAGAIIISPVTNVGGNIEVAIIQDPFENVIGVIEET